jgi:hypothetical protein
MDGNSVTDSGSRLERLPGQGEASDLWPVYTTLRLKSFYLMRSYGYDSASIYED